ncbi:MAG: diguanylate cyclase [Planctomycetes bacterium]|nr:diguanylate cyclase [Planctomycetota bacterium]
MISATDTDFDKSLAAFDAVKLVRATSVEEGMKFAADADLILMDVGFDSGVEKFLTSLKSSPKTWGVPVVVVLDNGAYHEAERAYFYGAADCVRKPIHPAITKAKISNHLQNLRHIRMIEQYGMIDPLTEIPNQRNFHSRFTAEWGRAIREMDTIGAILIEVEDLQSYAEQFGRKQSDQLLRMLAALFKSALKRPADLVARIDSNKFGVLLPQTDADGVKLIADDLCQLVRMANLPDSGDGNQFAVTIRMGLASAIPTIESNIEDFVAEAAKNTVFATNDQVKQ